MQGTIETFQNKDGGWPYGAAGPSWTEPTVYALLALVAAGRGETEAVRRGARWLETVQSSDGGWRPQASVKQSTWVGALVALLPENLISLDRRLANLNRILVETGQESTPLNRLRQWMIGNPHVKTGDGWPWFPGASAWVTPTALTILALRKHRTSLAGVEHRIEEGRQFLTMHACDSGGWNHGSARALGYQANAYPETTGVALLALSGTESPIKEAGIRAAQHFLPKCSSAEGFAWLSLGLSANGSSPDRLAPELEPRTVIDTALLSMLKCGQAGLNVWLPTT